MMRGRRFKLPVLSRLTQAWLCFAAIAAGGVAFLALNDGKTRAVVAMAVEGIERIAPPERRDEPAPPTRERFAAGEPATDMLAANDRLAAGEAIDVLASISDAEAPAEDPGADIFITVDGVPARAIGAERAKTVTPITPVAAPDEGLLRRTAYGQIPRVAADGRRAAEIYAQKFTPGDDPYVALIVGGLGINRALTERAIDELPASVTLAFAPYSKDLVFWTKRARDAGHEVMIEIPLENREQDADVLGPAALLTTRSDAENLQRLEWVLSRFQGYFGATNYLGARYSGDRAAMDKLLARLAEAGVAYVDDTGALSRRAADRDVEVVDRLVDPGYGDNDGQTRRDLESLEKVAAARGDALGKTYVHDASLKVVIDWAQSLEARGVALAPASAVLAQRAGDR